MTKSLIKIFITAFCIGSMNLHSQEASPFDNFSWNGEEQKSPASPSTPQPLIYRLKPEESFPRQSQEKLQDIQSLLLKSAKSLEDFISEKQNLPSEELVAQATPQNNQTEEPTEPVAAATQPEQKNILINFNNVSMVELIRFISRITNRNFAFDENDLQFNVTIISEEPTSLENIMTALLQELRIHDLILIEEGNNFIIHKNPKVNSISKVVTEDLNVANIQDAEIITKVFRLNTLDVEKAAALIRPLVSDSSIIEVVKESNQIIVTDLSSNVVKISQLFKSVDSPNSGLVIGQYVVKLSNIETLIPLAERIMLPIAQEIPIIFVPQPSTNSIFVVSTPYLVERTISIIQYLDQEQGQTQILDLQKLTIQTGAPTLPVGPAIQTTPTGDWLQGPGGNQFFRPGQPSRSATPPEGEWRIDRNGNLYFVPGPRGLGSIPPGQWILDSNGNWIFNLERFARGPVGAPVFPGGLKRVLKFYMHKLLYRRGDAIVNSLLRIAESLRRDEKDNEDLIIALGSAQWIEANNSIIATGTPQALEKVKELIEDLDIPLRQVFLEMLILNTTINDSLQYGVTYGTRFGGGPTSGAQGFIENATTIGTALATTGVTGLGAVLTSVEILPLVPNGTQMANANGFNLGVIGQKITRCGTAFGSIGALVSTLHDRERQHVILNPKVITEDNTPAEIFIGINTPYKTQSVSNDLGSIITSNYQFLDVGTRLKVTPYIGNDDMITLDIYEEVSNVISGLTTNVLTNTQNVGPTTSVNNMSTRVHMPNGYFLIIGGLMQDEYDRERSQVPCLGGVPILGGLFTNKVNSDAKTNTMIFIRPMIIDSEEEIQHLTKHQQDIWQYKRQLKDTWDYETEEALDWFNVKRTLYSEDECDWGSVE